MSIILPHPAFEIPQETAARLVEAKGLAYAEEWFQKYMLDRDDAIMKEQADRYRYGWEPPMWKVPDVLLGLPCFDPGFADRLHKEFDWTWEQFSKALLKHLGFDEPVRICMVNGGNRGGKSEWAAKRVNQILLHKKGRRGWCLHSNSDMSIDYQQILLWRYMPPELQALNPTRSKQVYLSYKEATGFGGGGGSHKYIFPGGSNNSFKFYSMEIRSQEGGEVDVIWDDEFVPASWVETQKFRVATRKGIIMITFTPVDGYTPCVKVFHEGATTTKESIAFLCDEDEKGVDEARVLGFQDRAAYDAAYKEYENADGSSYTLGPASRGEDPLDWLKGVPSQPAVPEGRKFAKVPRVMRCAGELDDGKMKYNRAVVFFHSSDNPYGNPSEVAAMVRGATNGTKKMRFYGLAEKLVQNRFPLFDHDIHVIGDDMIPRFPADHPRAGELDGTLYQIADPASGRNMAMGWFLANRYAHYMLREWPSGYPIPGVGVPGPWAVPSDNPNRFDGDRGPAQKPFGFGFKQLKKEIARLEGWDCYDRGERKDDAIKKWKPGKNTKEKVHRRYCDSRALNDKHLENHRAVTLQSDWQRWGVRYERASGARGKPGDIDDNTGVQEITDALSYDVTLPIDFYNRPKLYIHESCINAIFALLTWTGEDGQSGACKDFIDLIRYYFMSDCRFVDPKKRRVIVGGSY